MRRPGGDLVDRAQAAFAPAGGGVHAAHVGARRCDGRSSDEYVGRPRGDAGRLGAARRSARCGRVVTVRFMRHVGHRRAGQCAELLRAAAGTRRADGPAAAQISSKRNSSRSISVTGGVRMPDRRDAADREAGARLHELGIGAARVGRRPAPRPSSRRRAGRPRSRPAPPPRRSCAGRSMLLAICPTAMPSASAACCAVRAAVVEHTAAHAGGPALQHARTRAGSLRGDLLSVCAHAPHSSAAGAASPAMHLPRRARSACGRARWR